jgi:hypothetical protein
VERYEGISEATRRRAAGATVDATAAVATAETYGIPATTGLVALNNWMWRGPQSAVTVVTKIQQIGSVVQRGCTWIGQASN